MGAYPCVPDVLMGYPECMRMLEPSGEKAPIRIVVNITSSAQIKPAIMRKRGIVILALCIKLQRVRPIELSLLNGIGCDSGPEVLTVIQIDSKPLSLAHACVLLADVSFARQLVYSHAFGKADANGEWPDDRSAAHINKVLGLGRNDLYIKEAHVTDQLLVDPIAWINKEVERFNGLEN